VKFPRKRKAHRRENLRKLPQIQEKTRWADQLDWKEINREIAGAKTPEEVFEKSLAMVASLANHVTCHTEPSCPTVGYEDIFQAGAVGLLEACKRFDPKHASHATFPTFAYYYIRGAMLNEADRERFVHIPTKKMGVLKKLIEQGHLGAKNVIRHPRSLSEVVKSPQLATERATLLEDTIPDPSPSPDETAAKETRVQRMLDCIETLNPRQREVLTKRFGLGNQPEMTLEEIGKESGRTKERIRQIQDKALSVLRKKIYKVDPRITAQVIPPPMARPMPKPEPMRMIVPAAIAAAPKKAPENKSESKAAIGRKIAEEEAKIRESIKTIRSLMKRLSEN
jgi:RNA polymerase nonessential primary-like sigma factor